MPKEFWHNFQLFLHGNRLPSYLVQILKITGYDSALSIELLDRDKIKEIESDIRKRFRASSELFKKTVYENQNIKNFEFLPGHVTLFLGLGSYIKKYLEISLRDQRKYKGKGLDTIEEEVEIISKEEQDTLKKNLIKKVVKLAENLALSTEQISQENIDGDLQVIINSHNLVVYKCIFKCNFHDCESKIPCIFNKYWQISNLIKHIKTHQTETRKPSEKVVQELQKILNQTPNQAELLANSSHTSEK